MKKIITTLFCILTMYNLTKAQTDTTGVINLDGVSVVSFQRNTINTGSLLQKDELIRKNTGQEPSFLFSTLPSVFSLSDNGTEFGYGYFRIRGLDQTRINVNLDGCPWNEAEDFGTYFANSPDLMSSMSSIKVERGTSSSYNGTAGMGGGINLESVDVFSDNPSYAFIGGGSFGSYKLTVVENTKGNNWGLHIKATGSGTKGYRDFGLNRSKAFTLKFGYTFNQNHVLDFLSMTGYHENGQGWIGCTLEELKINPRASGNTKLEDDEWLMSMNRLQYKGRLSDNVMLVSSLYYQGQNGSYRMDLDNYMRRIVDPETPKTGILYDYGLTHNMIGGNTSVKVFWKKLNLTGGFNVYNYVRRHYSGEKGLNVPKEEEYSNSGRKLDFSGFVAVSWKPLRDLSITGNIQYRGVRFSYKDLLDHSIYFDSSRTCWDFINFGGVIEYTPIQELKIYTRYGKVSREPTRSDMFGGSEIYPGELATTTPETSNDLELGAEGGFSKVRFNVNLFYMWFRDELILNGEYGLNGLPCHENADNSFRRGVEAVVDWNLFGGLHFDNSISVSQNKVSTKTFGEKNHVMSPGVTTNSELYWMDQNLTLGTRFNYRSSIFLDMTNLHSLPEAWTLGFYGSVKIGNRFELGLNLNNVTGRINYCTGSVSEYGKVLYTQMAGFGFITNLKIYF